MLFVRDTDKLLQKKEATDKKIHDLRAKLIEGENDIIERRKSNNAEDKSLKDLDLSIAKSKNRYSSVRVDYSYFKKNKFLYCGVAIIVVVLSN